MKRLIPLAGLGLALAFVGAAPATLTISGEIREERVDYPSNKGQLDGYMIVYRVGHVSAKTPGDHDWIEAKYYLVLADKDQEREIARSVGKKLKITGYAGMRSRRAFLFVTSIGTPD